MAERRVDPVTFVLGGLSVAAGSIVLSGASLLHEARILLPVGLIAFGIALLVRVGTTKGDRAPTPQASPSIDPETATPEAPDDTDPAPTTTDTAHHPDPNPAATDTSNHPDLESAAADATDPERSTADAPVVTEAMPAAPGDVTARLGDSDRREPDDPAADDGPM